MLESNKQEASNICGSFVQQANGDIHNHGLGYNDVKDICQDIIRQQLSLIKKEALDILHSEIAAFEKIFIKKLESLENYQVLEKLRIPKFQFIVNKAMKEYTNSEDEETKEEIVNLLIDRLKVDDNNPEKLLIDDAIELLPILTKKQSYLLAALTLRKKGIVIIEDTLTARIYLDRLAKLFEYLDDVNYDLQYLKQKNCCTNIVGNSSCYDICKKIKEDFSLLFRHPCKKTDYDSFLNEHRQNRREKIESYESKISKIDREEKRFDYYSVQNEYKEFLHDYPEQPIVDGQPIVCQNGTEELMLSFCSTEGLENAIGNTKLTIGYNSMPRVFKEIIDLFIPFTNYEIENYLISLNNNWEKAFPAFKRNEYLNIDLTPLGAFIGRRIITKVTGTPTRPLEDFYK